MTEKFKNDVMKHNAIISCKSKEEFERVINLIHELDLSDWNGTGQTAFQMWDDFKNKSCISLNQDCYGEKNDFGINNPKVYSTDEAIVNKEENPEYFL